MMNVRLQKIVSIPILIRLRPWRYINLFTYLLTIAANIHQGPTDTCYQQHDMCTSLSGVCLDMNKYFSMQSEVCLEKTFDKTPRKTSAL